MNIITTSIKQATWAELKAAAEAGTIGELIQSGDLIPFNLKTGEEVAVRATRDGNGKMFFVLEDSITPTQEIDGAMTNFADTITDSFTAMLDRLQAIAKNVTFTAPAMAHGAIPYSAAAAVGTGNEDIGSTIEASNDELASVIVQTVTAATTAIVEAIQEHGGTGGVPDAHTLATSVIKEINRRTRMTGASPLIR